MYVTSPDPISVVRKHGSVKINIQSPATVHTAYIREADKSWTLREVISRKLYFGFTMSGSSFCWSTLGSLGRLSYPAGFVDNVSGMNRRTRITENSTTVAEVNPMRGVVLIMIRLPRGGAKTSVTSAIVLTISTTEVLHYRSVFLSNIQFRL